MSVLTSSRRADLFAALLDGDGRTDDPVVAPLAALGLALRAVPAVAGPAPEFRAALRQRLVAVATIQGVGTVAAPAARVREVSGSWRFQRRVAVLAGGAAAATAIAGVGVGASRSLPGDPFYSVKRASEDVQLATTFGTEAKGKRHLEFARTRLTEVQALVDHSSALGPVLPGSVSALGPLSDGAKTSIINSTLQDMDAETRAGANDLYAAYQSSGSREPLQALDGFTRTQFATLQKVLPALPVPARARAEQSLSLLHVVATRTVGLAHSSTGTGSTGTGGTGGSRHRHTSGSPAPGSARSHHGGNNGGGSTHTGKHGNGGTGPAPVPQPNPQTPSAPSLPLPVPVPVPTIPPLPTSLPLPTALPTSIPTLPSIGLLP